MEQYARRGVVGVGMRTLHPISYCTATVSLLSPLISSVFPSVESGWMDGRVFHNRPVSDARPSGNLLNYDLWEKWDGRGMKI